jgi:hypothetical protein
MNDEPITKFHEGAPLTTDMIVTIQQHALRGAPIAFEIAGRTLVITNRELPRSGYRQIEINHTKAGEN